MKFIEGPPLAVSVPVTDLYGTVVGELSIDRDGKITGSMDSDSFWNSVTRVGRLGLVTSVSITPNVG
jgi:hypothetical protein